jgi:glycosyltransferase involved in cell wall biosynthesis
MKVLIATGLFPPDIGGPATYSKILSEELPKHKISVEVLSFGEVRSLPKGIRHFAYLLKLLRKGKSCDVIHAQDPVSVGFPALIASSVLRKKFVLKVVGDYAWEQGFKRFGVADLLDEFVKRKKKYPLFVRFLQWIEILVARNADKVIVPSKYLAGIVSSWDKKIKPEVIYNAFLFDTLSEGREEVRRMLSLQGKIILSAGRLVPWKGFDTLIKIMPHIRKEIPDAILYIVGEGEERPYLKGLIEDNNAGSYIKLLGAVSHNDLLQYIKASDVFILNTGYEGLSHQLIEVMSLGTPIITTKAGGNTELIENGVSGILFDYNDEKRIAESIIGVLSGEVDMSQMTEYALKKSKEFTYEKMMEKTVKALQP